MHRFFVPQEQITGDLITIIATDAHHITRVLRLQPGDEIECVDEQEQLHVIKLHQVGTEVTGLIQTTVFDSRESPLALTLFQSLAKGDKMDLVIQKAVELGVQEVIPFISQRTIVKLKPKQALHRLERWKRIAYEAAKQSGRTRLPNILPIWSFGEVKKNVQMRTERGDLVIVAHEQETKKSLKHLEQVPSSIAVLIGPEGGFTSHEIETLKVAGGECFSLGPRILRTETAGLVALSMLGYKWGDLG